MDAKGSAYQGVAPTKMVGSKRQQTPLFLTSISPSPPTQSPPRKRTIHQYGKKGKELKRRSRFGGSETSESEHDLANFDFDDEHGIPNQDMDEDTDGRSHPNEDEDVQVSKQEEMERKIVGRLMGNYKGRQCESSSGQINTRSTPHRTRSYQ